MERHDRLLVHQIPRKFVDILTSGCTDSGNNTGGRLKAATALVSPATSRDPTVMDGRVEGAPGKVKLTLSFRCRC